MGISYDCCAVITTYSPIGYKWKNVDLQVVSRQLYPPQWIFSLVCFFSGSRFGTRGGPKGTVKVHTAAILALVFALSIIGNCWGQGLAAIAGEDSRSSITDVLSKARVSGSLAYWGRCANHEARPDLPPIRSRPEDSGGAPPVQVLRGMFADDPKMHVTQETDGMIRMFESDVPRDLLDVRISHISFKDSEGRNGVWNPRQARRMLADAPEVRAFMRSHNIDWASDAEFINDIYGGPHDYQPHVSGDLYDVTLAEAMDYVLKSFPGFWVYENCRKEDGTRAVFFEIFGSMLRTHMKSE